jgi:hypothetical protein
MVELNYYQTIYVNIQKFSLGSSLATSAIISNCKFFFIVLKKYEASGEDVRNLDEFYYGVIFSMCLLLTVY